MPDGSECLLADAPGTARRTAKSSNAARSASIFAMITRPESPGSSPTSSACSPARRPIWAFRGLARPFDRRGLLFFNADVPLDICFTRTDNGAQVDAAADVRRVPGDPQIACWMQRPEREASPQEVGRFGTMWQDRGAPHTA